MCSVKMPYLSVGHGDVRKKHNKPVPPLSGCDLANVLNVHGALSSFLVQKSVRSADASNSSDLSLL